MAYVPKFTPGATSVGWISRRDLRDNLEPLRRVNLPGFRGGEVAKREVMRRWKRGRTIKTADDLVLIYQKYLERGAYPCGIEEAELRSMFGRGEVKIIYGGIDDDIVWELIQLEIEVLFTRRKDIPTQVWFKGF